MESNILYFGPPGILCFFNKSLVKAFDVSIWARFFLGPTTFTPSFQRASATPFCRGFSGPTIAIETLFSLA